MEGLVLLWMCCCVISENVCVGIVLNMHRREKGRNACNEQEEKEGKKRGSVCVVGVKRTVLVFGRYKRVKGRGKL